MSSFVFLKIIFARAGLIKGNASQLEVADMIVCDGIEWEMSAKDSENEKEPKREIKLDVLTVTRQFDESSVRMLNAMKNRDLIKSARFAVMAPIVTANSIKRMREQFVIQITDAYLEDVDINTSESGDAALITETLKFKYSQIHFEYTKRTDDLRLTKATMNYSSVHKSVLVDSA